MHIDSFTLVLMTSGVTAISCLWLACEWWQGREASLASWCIGFGCIAIGSAVSLLRLKGADTVGIWASHGLLVAAHAMFLRGCLALRGSGRSLWWLAGLPIWAVCYVLPDQGPAAALVAVNSLTVCLYAGASAAVLFRRRAANSYVSLLAVVFALHAAVYAVRAALVGINGSFVSLNRFDGSAISAVLFEGVLVAVALAIFMVSAAREQREAELSLLADTDPLTGALNRRAFFTGARQSLAKGGETPNAHVLVIDLDHFKRLNDAHGHGFGDAVLTLLCEVARAHLGRRDLFCRLGGEEFAIYLPDSDTAAAAALAEAVRADLARRGAAIDGVDAAPTVSIGIGEVLGAGDLVDALARADAALYSAKHAGRDRVAIAGPAQSSKPLAAAVPVARAA